jgi:hypothetical protein
MAASKRQMNWTGVGFTPTGGSATSYTGVKSVKIDSGGSLAKFAGDGDRYNTTSVNDFNEPTVEVEAADIVALEANPVGIVGTLTATWNDAKNGTGAGAITFTFSNAQVASINVSGKHRDFGMGSVKFELFAPDGVTNPISSSVATGS